MWLIKFAPDKAENEYEYIGTSYIYDQAQEPNVAVRNQSDWRKPTSSGKQQTVKKFSHFSWCKGPL
jgi:hypothetical protein